MRLGRRLATGVAEHPSAPSPAPAELATEQAAPQPAESRTEPRTEAPRPAELAER